VEVRFTETVDERMPTFIGEYDTDLDINGKTVKVSGEIARVGSGEAFLHSLTIDCQEGITDQELAALPIEEISKLAKTHFKPT
jgi:hypothetical protein